MQVEVNKNELAGALTALGKFVCRTSPVEAFRSVEIKGHDGVVSFRTANKDESISYQIVADGVGEFTSLVLFDTVRNAVKGCKTQRVGIEWNGTFLVIDGTVMPGIGDTLPVPDKMPESARCTSLPENFVELLGMAAPVVNRNDYRKVLQGVCVESEGMTVTNGKELLHIPLELDTDRFTLPFPLALMATKAQSAGTMHTWRDDLGMLLFRIDIGPWMWSGKAIEGTYPNWKAVVPKQEELTRSVSFTPERAEQLKNWLKSVPDDQPNNAIELRRNNDALILNNLKGLETGVTAYFTGDWNERKLTVNRDILLRLLNEGHHKIECQDEHGPFLATGGIGQYIAMPLHYAQPEKKEEPKEEPKVEPNKEESNMNETNTTVVPAPVQVVAPNNEPVTELSPLEELTATIDAFKAKLKSVFDESNVLSRKVKEVALNQKQKERDFILAKRAIERIRLASSF